ncbi:putative flippase GtrA [Actimicrobium sp. GrIS 1.19]|uniref:GtrA family protein n=1 Tax=Actimicrobium sp. GrIS 1.19 TaxID=3071708 RepID=UPI002E070F35|nr:putative flippase GtrA [Actimicrobium sp. GrIS 1.19]
MINFNATIQPKRLSLRQFGIYALVGAAGTLVHYSILLLLVEQFRFHAITGSIVGSVAGAVINFILNHRVTFRSTAAYSKTAPSFFAIAAVSLLLNAALMYVLVDLFSVRYIVAQLVTTSLILSSNYFLNAILTFGAKNPTIPIWLRINRRTQMLLAIVMIVICAVSYSWWLLDPRHFFLADDWNWLSRAHFWTLETYFNVLPILIYNDRPVGGLFIMAMYQIFSLNYVAIHASLLVLHLLNCILLFAIAMRYMPMRSALLGAILAATWFSTIGAIGWAAAIFDVLGATLCLAVLFFRQLALKRSNIWLDVVGVLCYVLAIRTKEFALGMIALLFVMGIVAERQKVKDATRQLAPYGIVFLVYLVAYARLYTMAKIDGAYSLNLSPISILSTLWYYFGEALYHHAVGNEVFGGIVFALVIGTGFAYKEGWRPIVFGLLGFAILLGPTLLLTAHLDTLYLYAPHFLLALAIGAMVGRQRVSTISAVSIAAVLLAAPFYTNFRTNIVNFVLSKGEVAHAQVVAAQMLLAPIQHGETVFISGVEPWANPFSFNEGNSIRLIFLDDSIIVKTDKPESELIPEFCKTAGPKKFLRFDGGSGKDVTATLTSNCSEFVPLEK